MPPPGSQPLRLVLDTNVVAAALLWNGPPRRIVTGDRKHLLPIGTHQGVAIVTAREVVERIEARSKI